MASTKGILHRLPAELQLQVLKLFFSQVDPQQGLALLQALRSSSSTAFTIYPEAIQIYHRMHAFTLTSRNQAPNMALGRLTHNSIFNLGIDFSIITSRSRMMIRKWTPPANPAPPATSSPSSNSARTTSLRQEFSAPQPVINERIRPLPSYKTISAFPNLRVLRLDAAVVKIKLFHTLVALVSETVVRCEKRERVEVGCLDVLAKRGAVVNCSCAACADNSGNDDWVHVLNRFIGVRAKLMFVPGGEPAAAIAEELASLNEDESAVRAASAGQVMWWFWDRMDGGLLKREKRMRRERRVESL